MSTSKFTAIAKLITAYGGPAMMMCDARCDKAWGRDDRPRCQLSEDEDDFAYLSDDELGEAPADPGSSEGGVRKPALPEDRLNRWCFRSCERCSWAGHREMQKIVELRDFSKRLCNLPGRLTGAGPPSDRQNRERK